MGGGARAPAPPPPPRFRRPCIMQFRTYKFYCELLISIYSLRPSCGIPHFLQEMPYNAVLGLHQYLSNISICDLVFRIFIVRSSLDSMYLFRTSCGIPHFLQVRPTPFFPHADNLHYSSVSLFLFNILQ